MAELFVTSVVAQRMIADEHYELILSHHPALDRVQPGQFIDVRVSAHSSYDPLLRRPFSLYRRFANGNCSFVYRVVGRGTQALTQLKPGDPIDILGPLGNGFRTFPKARRVALVGGGVGVPPMLYLGQHLARDTEMKAVLGFGAQSLAFGPAEFSALGIETQVATIDGSLGKQGLVTDLLRPLLEAGWCDGVYACGPKPMLAAVAELTAQYQVPAQLAFEEAMACGVGACLSCVLPIRTAGGVTYRRVCKEGPVFNAEEVVFHA